MLRGLRCGELLYPNESDERCPCGLKQDVIKYLKDKGKPERENALSPKGPVEMARGLAGG